MEYRTKHVLRIGLLLSVAVAIAGCTGAEGEENTEAPPVVVEEIDGTELARLTLSTSAAERLDIQLATVETADEGLTVPSAAVIIDAYGDYWVYTQPEPLVYVREQLHNAYEENQWAYFSNGPEAGTTVVVIGVPELYGAEFGIGY